LGPRDSGKERRPLKAFKALRELAKSSMALVEEFNMVKAENLITSKYLNYVASKSVFPIMQTERLDTS